MIQDDKRENELIKLFKLKQHKNRKRSDIDAFLMIDGVKVVFELKSTTVGAVSTASPLTLNHTKKWKNYHWIIGVYDEKTEKLKYCHYGTPDNMAGWLSFIEQDIKRGLTISKMIVDRIDMDMMVAIFGDKNCYSYKEAKFVFKNLYSKKEYKKLKDKKDGYSKEAMLKMFKYHNWKYLERGSNLNNPKISKNRYKSWPKITKMHSQVLLDLVRGYLENNEK